jgi:hypothetical protein
VTEKLNAMTIDGFVKEEDAAEKELPQDEIKEKVSLSEGERDVVDKEDGTEKRLFFFRCFRCGYIAHETCLPPLEDEPANLDEDDLLVKRIKKYRRDWKCFLCVQWNHDIDKIIAYQEPEDADLTEEAQDTENSRSTIVISDDDLPKVEDDSDFDTKDECKNQNKEQSNVEGERRFLVKWKDCSYRHVEWVPEQWLVGVNPSAVRAFLRKEPTPAFKQDVVMPEWTRIDRILNVEFKNGKTLLEVKFRSSREEDEAMKRVKSALIKWKGLHYDEGGALDLQSFVVLDGGNLLIVGVHLLRSVLGG